MTDSQVAPSSSEPAVQENTSALLHLNNSPVADYFETFNQGDFQATAGLFAPSGQLLPPFESALVGPAAIADYLEQEAKGMRALPQQAAQETLDTGDTQIIVTGQVQTPLFTVNVRWTFVLDPEAQLLTVRIKLLAGLRDLLHLKRSN